MKYPRTALFTAFALFAPLLATSSAAQAGATIEIDKEKSLTIGLLLQPWFKVEQNGAMAPDTASMDFYLRRVRLIFSGQYTPYVHFFIDTDMPNWGQYGKWDLTKPLATQSKYVSWNKPLIIQDAWLEFNLSEMLQIDTGMLLVPFSHQGMQGATGLHGIDYHTDLMKYSDSTMTWREMGVMVRGAFLKNALEYRLAVTNGLQSGAGYSTAGANNTVVTDPRGYLNPFDYPRVSGRLAYHFFDSEAGPGAKGFFLKGVNLKRDGDKLITDKKVLSVGVSGSYQNRSSYVTLGRSDVVGFAADVFADWPMNADKTEAITGQVNYYWYEFGKGHPLSGMGLAAEVGYRWNCIEPMISFDWYDVRAMATGDLVAVRGGFNWWLIGHTASLKVEFGGKRVVVDENPNTKEKFVLTGLAQTQLLF